ncbi:hypothetical protein B0H34DRAFT_799993 [Crassisporium funariophilum]|nr:hypothetical protein B0H34DRAFT_799993 [Crassisporium funariophilum]
MSLTTLALDASATLICVSLSILLYKNTTGAGAAGCTRPQGYILQNEVSHARLLPTESANAFTYPTLALLVSLDALESHALDLGSGWIFGYGGLWGRLVGLRPNPYLMTSSKPCTIRSKLEAILRQRGLLNLTETFQDAWMMTMPSFIGHEGINPLTVYFCYQSNAFWVTILEIHNTFGESHIHVLQVNQNEDDEPSAGYDHQWTFPREFHVSPFNDRSGYYTISVKNPSHPPMPASLAAHLPCQAPKPSVRVHLYTESESDSLSLGPLKLTALLRPTSATPLTASRLVFALAQAPFSLLITFPRIAFVAWKLHYQKRLDVFLRPEPLPGAKVRSSSPSLSKHQLSTPAGGVRWLNEGLLESIARRRVEEFLKQRVQETGINVTLIATDPSIPRLSFSSSLTTSPSLIISYLSPRIFTILFESPSAKHAFLLGESEGIFQPSSRDLFLSIFTPSTPSSGSSIPGWLQRIRLRSMPRSLTLSAPNSHFLDGDSVLGIIQSSMLLYSFNFLSRFEKWIFQVSRARIVEGQEPWKQWDRASARSNNGPSLTKLLPRINTIGSVRREPQGI